MSLVNFFSDAAKMLCDTAVQSSGGEVIRVSGWLSACTFLLKKQHLMKRQFPTPSFENIISHDPGEE